MPVSLPFEQVDVFSEQPFKGNAVAVVIGADRLSSQQMLEFAAWTQLSETTFLLRPTVAEADYRVRIFTPLRELPFAGHPTLGSCQVWLNQGGGNAADEIVQECLAGLIRIRRKGALLSFAAPPLLRGGAVEDEVLRRIESGLGLSPGQVLGSQWVDNGPAGSPFGWPRVTRSWPFARTTRSSTGSTWAWSRPGKVPRRRRMWKCAPSWARNSMKTPLPVASTRAWRNG